MEPSCRQQVFVWVQELRRLRSGTPGGVVVAVLMAITATWYKTAATMAKVMVIGMVVTTTRLVIASGYHNGYDDGS